VPVAGEDATATASGGSARSTGTGGAPPLGPGNVGAMPYGPGTTGAIQYGAPNVAAPAGERPRSTASPRESTRAPVPVTEVGPRSARDACGSRTFIALAVCMDRVCEEARFRTTPECVAILARKGARQTP